MSIRIQDIPTTTSLDLTDKLLVCDTLSENLVTVETLMAMAHLCCQGNQGSSVTIPGDGSMNKISLTTIGLESPSGASGMSLSSGGIKVSAAGTYKVTANLYLSTSANPNGVYIHYGSTYSGATELCGVFTDAPRASIKQVIGIVYVPANTIFFLSGRASTTQSTGTQGWLLVERYA